MSGTHVSKALIPAAGRGTRFLPFTKSVPKELAPLVTTPVIEQVVAEAAGCGITDVLLVLGPGKQAIADYFARDLEFEAVLAAKGDEAGLAAIQRPAQLARMHQVIQPRPRGLGDAVARGAEFVAGEAFLVLLPDDLIDPRDELLAPMLSAQQRHGGVVLGLIAVPPEQIEKYGCVELAPGMTGAEEIVQIIDLVEKPAAGQAPSALAMIGRYILPPEIFAALRRTEVGSGGEVQLTDAIRILAAEGVPIHGVVFTGRRHDTGDRLGYLQAVVDAATGHPEIGADFTSWLEEYVLASTTIRKDGTPLGEPASG